jgi:hypothetical protein
MTTDRRADMTDTSDEAVAQSMLEKSIRSHAQWVRNKRANPWTYLTPNVSAQTFDDWADGVATLSRQLAEAQAERDALRETLKFYRDGWAFKTLKGRPGLEWHPKEALLDDCGNRARDALGK